MSRARVSTAVLYLEKNAVSAVCGLRNGCILIAKRFLTQGNALPTLENVETALQACALSDEALIVIATCRGAPEPLNALARLARTYFSERRLLSSTQLVSRQELSRALESLAPSLQSERPMVGSVLERSVHNFFEACASGQDTRTWPLCQQLVLERARVCANEMMCEPPSAGAGASAASSSVHWRSCCCSLALANAFPFGAQMAEACLLFLIYCSK